MLALSLGGLDSPNSSIFGLQCWAVCAQPAWYIHVHQQAIGVFRMQQVVICSFVEGLRFTRM